MFILKTDTRVYKIEQKNNYYKQASVSMYLLHIFITAYILNQEQSFRSSERIMFRASNYLAALSF